MIAALECTEPVLCFALSAAARNDWQVANEALRACVDHAELHRTREYDEYDLATMLQQSLASVECPVEIVGGHAGKLVGDAGQIAAMLRAVSRNAILEHDAALRMEIVEIDAVPILKLYIDGPGRFPNRLSLGYGLTVPFPDLELIWTAATRGGRIDARPGQLDLRLKGVRAIHETPTGCDPIVASLCEAENRARILASGEFTPVEAVALRDCLTALLAELDAQDDPPKPCDLGALVRDYLSEMPANDENVPMQIAIAPDVPPVAIRRNRFGRLLGSLHALGRAALARGGALRFEAEYDTAQRSLSLCFTGQGETECDAAAIYLPSIERALDVHSGELAADIQPNGFTLLMTVPDSVARTLDVWLPGWHSFAPRSIQMLRLLKSGGPVPPEEMILHGVLEDELERRLLPRLGIAPAATLIHDINPRMPVLTPASPQRIEKVLSQLKRGKPKKEICAPPYAAEILWMFSRDDRHASAIGLTARQTPEIEEFCKALAGNPVDYLRALVLVGQLLEPPQS